MTCSEAVAAVRDGSPGRVAPLLPASQRAAAQAAVRAIARVIAELLWHLGAFEAPRRPPLQ
jgi:hypothetical protein